MRYILQTSRELNLVGHVFSPEDCYALLENRFVDIVLIDEGTAKGKMPCCSVTI